MPKAHRQTDSRFCGSSTVVINQSSVEVNGKLWAVEGDQDDHVRGDLIAKTGARNVYIEGKRVIVALGDEGAPDLEEGHTTGPTNPSTGSDNVFAYGD
jgi:uncharacterized Zn-binding protein involved in type VI secretion